MQTHSWQVTGLEPDQSARTKALALYGIHLLPAQRLMDLENSSYDAITLWHVLEHVHPLDAYMDRLKQLVKPDGRIFIAVPNYTSFDARHYGPVWAAYDVPRHLYHFSPESIKTLMLRHGLTLLSIRPMWFDSFYISLLSEKYKTGGSHLIKGLFAGAWSNVTGIFHPNRFSSLIYICGR
jgi:SAM-dependent methyltransferase